MSTADVPATAPGRTGEIDVLVVYRVGPMQTGMVRIPKKEFSEKTLKAAVKEDVDKKAKFVGMRLKV